MASITTRAGKGSALTNAEVDANFTNINTELGQKLTSNQSITFSGDATGSGATSVALTLANSGVTAGTYGSATDIPQFVVDAKGRITSVSNNALSVSWASPGAIGSATPNTGAFTTLSSTGDATLASSSGNVGVGVSPTSKFHVYDAASAVIALQGDSTTQTQLIRASADTSAPIHLISKARGSIASPSAVATGDNAGIVRFRAYGGANYRNVADIIASVSAYASDTAISGALIFRTNSASTDVTERARITHDGRFFLGSTNTALNAGIVNAVAPAAADIASIYSNPTISSSTTGTYNGYITSVSTVAASFTLPSLVHFSANQATFGAGSTVTTQYGFVAGSSLTGAGTNVGFLGEISSGSGRFNFYASGTADNYFAGSVGIGTAAPPVAKLDVGGNQAINIVSVAALNIDCSAGNFFTKTINGNSTFTVSNVPASRAFAFTLELTHTSGTVTWFSGVQWPGGSAPALTTGKVHLFTFVTDDGGTIWRAVSNINYNS